MEILVVHNNSNMLFLIQDFLERAGHKIITATSAPGALQRINEQKPDAIILDMLMPGLTGFQIVGAIRKLPETADIPIILSSVTEGPSEEGKRLGIVDFLRKPIESDKFRKIIRDLKDKKEKPRILVIDDNEEDQRLIEVLLLKEAECIIFKAKDGASGFKLAQDELPDLILMDYLLPVKDGLELTKELKKNQKTSNIPIVLITAYMPSNIGEKSFIMSDGVTAFGSFTFEEFIEKIKEFLKDLELNK